MSNTTTPHIAFIGRAGAGKTTAAELLVKGFGYERLSFAAPLKIMVGSDTDRAKLQDLGMKVREECPDGLVNLLIEAMDNSPGPWPFVCDDMRFENEAHRLKVEGFKVVRIVADRNRRVLRLRANGKLQDESQLEHESESALDSYPADHMIYNDGDPEALLGRLTEILNRERR